MKALCRALDALAVAALDAEEHQAHPEGADPTRAGYPELRRRVSELFPELGYYNTVLDVSAKTADTSMAVGDAIDDLTDIALELDEVEARWATNGEEDALWRLAFGFRSHWGEHLRWLQVALHDGFSGEAARLARSRRIALGVGAGARARRACGGRGNRK